MVLNSFPDLDFRKLNALVSDYCGNSSAVRNLFEIEPSLHEIARYANDRPFSSEQYGTLHEVLLNQYARLLSIRQVNENILYAKFIYFIF
jgi:hypothetical protein